ncbi:hypothetical protein BaRGS_00039295 [Batillaria attramentaria]|uniref:Uncharacterized protein n=1 Tax=Batillaria attramentaria TaxID=370345 RepID=A0ABD0J3L4_9CAEN
MGLCKLSWKFILIRTASRLVLDDSAISSGLLCRELTLFKSSFANEVKSRSLVSFLYTVISLTVLANTQPTNDKKENQQQSGEGKHAGVL